MASKPTGEQAGQVIPAGANVQMSDAPYFYASGMQAAPVANDVVMTFSGIRVGIAMAGGEQTNVAQGYPVVNVTVSVMTFKEMVGALQTVLEGYEAEHGEITTPFLKAKTA